MLQFHEKKIRLTKIGGFFSNFFFLIAPYSARVRGSVFNMKFRVLARKFESFETSPGFAQLLEENWNQKQ